MSPISRKCASPFANCTAYSDFCSVALFPFSLKTAERGRAKWPPLRYRSVKRENLAAAGVVGGFLPEEQTSLASDLCT